LKSNEAVFDAIVIVSTALWTEPLITVELLNVCVLPLKLTSLP